MTSFEQLALIYFSVMAVAARRHARPRGWVYVAGAIVLVIVARFRAPWEVRAWLPHAYLVLGYWIPAAFVPMPFNDHFEEWLRRTDERLFGSWGLGVGRWRTRHVFELAYLLCYPIVPLAFAVVFLRGDAGAITRFWVAVLLAGYVCYGTLPWTAARPPRLTGRPEGRPLQPTEPRLLARINVYVLGRVSHNLNTFPSGHVAVSLAAALVVCSVSIAWGVAFVLIASAIAVAAVGGRYHYAIDVLIGLGVGLLAYAVSFGSPVRTSASMAPANVSISSTVV